MLAELSLPRQHLARDLVGTLVPFSGFVALALLARTPAAAPVLEMVKGTSITWLPLVLAVYAATGYAAGKLVGALGVAMTGWVSHLPGIGSRYSYAKLYAQHRAQIDEFYEQVYAHAPTFDLSLTDRVNALKSYFEHVHPNGAASVQRQIARVDITRAAFIYGAVLFASEALSGMPHPAWALLYAAIMALSALSTPRRIEKVVRTELVYLQSAARMKADTDAEKITARKTS